MIKIKKVFVENEGKNAIIIDGNGLSAIEKEEVLDVLSRWKNMFLFGYPHHAKKRKLSAKAGIIYEEWKDSPKVCISYIPNRLANGDLSIELLFSNTTQKTEREIIFLISLFQQHVIEEIQSL